MNEIYKPVKNYEDYYKVSNFGNVFSVRSNKNLRPGKDKDGYLNVVFCINYKKKNYKIHRLVMETFKGYSNLTVDHIDENKLNNKLNNLQYLSSKENTSKSTKGIKNFNYCNKKYLWINKNKKEECTQNDLLLKYKDLKASSITKIKLGKRFKHKGWKCLCLI